MKQCQIFFPHSCHSTRRVLRVLKVLQKNNAAYLAPCTLILFSFSTYNFSVNVYGTCHAPQNFSRRTNTARMCVYRRFFSSPLHSIALHGRDAFSNRWWPMATFFPLFFCLSARCVPCICFSRFFFAFLQVHPLSGISLSPIGVLFIFHGPWPAALSSTLFHLIKGHKLPARSPYNDEKKEERKREEVKRMRRPQIARLVFFSVAFLI